MTLQRGTPTYWAPEIYEPNYDFKIDVYAAGRTVYEFIYNDQLL